MSSDTDEAAQQQLQNELRLAAPNSLDLKTDRPIIYHLNADSSWLLSLPYPPHAERPSGRCRFNILLDVWLRGPQVDLFEWFSSQEHASLSSVQSLSEINQLLKAAETATISSLPHHDGTAAKITCFIDAVFCSHEFTDHCHENTLRELPSHVPIYGPSKATSLVRSWKHFTTVVEIPVLHAGFDWEMTLLHNSSWIGVGRIHTWGDAPIYFHSALVIFFLLANSPKPEAIVYTPHGMVARSIKLVMTGIPGVKPLALLHGLHNVSLLGARLNLGIENALEIQKFLKAPYWFSTHDEVKMAKGIVANFLNRIEHSLPFAPGSHPITDTDDKRLPAHISDSSFTKLGNGQSMVLR